MKTFKISQLFTLFLFTQIGFLWGKPKDFHTLRNSVQISQECRFQIKTFSDENHAKQTIIENCKKEIQNLINAEIDLISQDNITALTLDEKQYTTQEDMLGLCYISANYAMIKSIAEGYRQSDKNSPFIKLFSLDTSSLKNLCNEIIININHDLINHFDINKDHLTQVLNKCAPALHIDTPALNVDNSALTFFSELLLHNMLNAIKAGAISLTKQQKEEVKNLTPKMDHFEKNDQLWKASIENIINNHTTRININTILGATGTILGAAAAIALGFYFKKSPYIPDEVVSDLFDRLVKGHLQ